MKIMKRKTAIITLIFTFSLCSYSYAAITSVTVTPATQNTLSNGKSYYLAGVQYTFRVQATDPLATGKSYWNDITLRFYEGATIRQSCTISVDTDTATAETGVVVDNIIDNTTNYTNLDYQITLRFRWDCTDFNAAAANRIEAFVREDGGSNGTDTKFVNYGVCASIQVRNFLQDGDAADGRVNPWHLGFNVTGAIVYYVAGETISNEVEDIDAGEITDTELLLDGGGTGYTDNTMGDDLTYAVDPDYMFDNEGGDPGSLGDHYWTVSATMNTAGGPEVTAVANQLLINCNKVQVTAILFFDGLGADLPYQIRSVNAPGTKVRITAQLEDNSLSLGGDLSMRGNTTITVRNTTEGTTFTVQILSGQTQGEALVTTPTEPDITDGSTEVRAYEISSITGSAYDDEQNIPARIDQPANPQVYWDDKDPPGDNTAGNPFTTWVGRTVTAYSFTINWTPLTDAAPDRDADFYTYRIYYKKGSDATWKMVDRSTSGFAALGTISTSTATIDGLAPINVYNYYITAVDVFGQEVATDLVAGANQLYDVAPGPNSSGDYFGVIPTATVSIEITISDGIESYDDTHFTNNTSASTRPMRDSAIRVNIKIVGGSLLDGINLIVAPDPGVNLIDTTPGTGTGEIYTTLTEGTDYVRVNCSRTTATTFVGYISSNNPLMTMGSNVKFILETVQSGKNSYADHDSETETPPGDPNNREWNFAVVKQTTFKPWPVRILNNVITKKNPVAYPSYYLSDDAYVTIRVFDIKGRQVATLLDSAYRRGGQNIKERGWRGDNKAQRKLGVGLYYIQIKAKRARDGKVILNKFRKVVMAR